MGTTVTFVKVWESEGATAGSLTLESNSLQSQGEEDYLTEDRMVLALAADTQVIPSPWTGLTGGALPCPLPSRAKSPHRCMQTTAPGSVPEDLVEHVGHKVLLLIAGQAQQLGSQILAGPLGLHPALLVLQPL